MKIEYDNVKIVLSIDEAIGLKEELSKVINELNNIDMDVEAEFLKRNPYITAVLELLNYKLKDELPF